MKKRRWYRRQRSSSSVLKPLSRLRRAKRKAFSFEQLEERHYFSATPVEFQTSSLSNATPEGAAALWLRELQWAAESSANQGQGNYTFLAIPNDPLFADQWHLLNTGQLVGSPEFEDLFGVAGQDINVVPVWNMGYTGEGVVVAVIDSGVQLTHPDLASNIDPTRRFNAVNGSSNAFPSFLTDNLSFHGTAVAGLIGARWNNLGNQVVDSSGNPVFDVDGDPVYEGGGTGVAPNVTLVPIKISLNPLDPIFNPNQLAAAFQYALNNGVDITNNSWGPDHEFNRTATALTPAELQVLRDTVIFGRNGLGMINIFAAGNDAGPSFNPGFENFGNYDSASYNAWANSRYTIAVTSVDHDGLYVNADGSVTTYANAGASVLVAAPSGSNVAQNVAEDNGKGSGLWTTDLVGDLGLNAERLPNGSDPDRDFLGDPNYTSRFNGTSASAAIVSGVVALMLEANPNLTYRDVQEILVRSARQNAQFEQPSSGAGAIARKNSWITNQTGFFRNPDPYDPADSDWVSSSVAVYSPLADPARFSGRIGSHYEPQPSMFTNAAGFTVSQGYGIYGEQIGYGHGVVDAELAVQMAKVWHAYGQNINPGTEKTFTTFVVHPGTAGLGLPAAERSDDDSGRLLVPGGIGSDGSFVGYWNQYFADMPFPADYDGPFEADRGAAYIPFSVPPEDAVNIEWVEVKVSLDGPAEAMEHIRLTLVSPEGTVSELHNWYVDPGTAKPQSIQSNTGSSASGWQIDPAGAFNEGDGNFVWTFSTNRHWGENSGDAVIIDPITGMPMLDQSGQPLTHGWEMHIENWGTADVALDGLEIVWHGKPISGTTAPDGSFIPAQRVQGFVGIDIGADNDFNYTRYIQNHLNPQNAIRGQSVVRVLDPDQEPFAANILVEAFRVVNGVEQNVPAARFLTGDDGNYYFDLVPGDYVIRATDPEGRVLLDDTQTGPGFQRHYQSEWHISEEWFFAPQREDLSLDPARFGVPGEILFDNLNGVPMPFLDGFNQPVASAVKNINFLIKDDLPVQSFDVTGTVYADHDGDGVFNGNDAPLPDVFVYQDENRNGSYDSGEQFVLTNASGQYTLTIPATMLSTYAVGVDPRDQYADYIPTDPGGDGVENVFAGPGSPPQIVNFFLDPSDANQGPGDLGTIFGVVFNDLDKDGLRDVGEAGVGGVTVFLDATQDGVWNIDPVTGLLEVAAVTASNGAFAFSSVAPGLIWIDVHIPNEGTANAAWSVTTPTIGRNEVNLASGGTISGVTFGLENRANSDWGDLPNTFNTTRTSAPVGPSHRVVQGFRLGSNIDGEVDGIPTIPADGDDLIGGIDDGVRVISNGGILRAGVNLLEVTVFGFGGVLTGWIDWDKSGTFSAAEKIVWRDSAGALIGDEAELVQGTYTLQVIAPAGVMDGFHAARFRWGEPGLNFFGPAMIGEVEDYILTYSNVPLSGVAGDYNNDGMVDAADYVLWRKYLNTGTYLFNDTTPGFVNNGDYAVWQSNLGAMAGAGAGGGAQAVVDEPQPAPAAAAAPGEASVAPSAANPVSVASSAGSAANEPAASPTPLVVDFMASATASTSFTATNDLVAADATIGGASGSQADLLLLDEAMADLDPGDDDAPLVDRFGHEEDNVGDLELAAVFEDESNWWGA